MKKILLLGAGLEQSIAIQQAKDLGYYVIACDERENAIGMSIAHKAFCIDIKDINSVMKIAVENSIDGIMTHGVEIPDVVAKIAKKLGLPGLDPVIAKKATNKVKRLECLSKAGIPCANYRLVQNDSEAIKAAEEIGYPVIVKPIDSSGARGVQKIDQKSNILESLQIARTYSKNSSLLIEECMDGPEISTESFIFKGKVHTFGFADRNYKESDFFKPFFIEDGVNIPSSIDSDTWAKVISLVEKTINAIGIDFGAAKGDVIIHKGEPKIIEMAARTSGGWFSSGSIPLSSGINVLEPLIQVSVRDEPNLNKLRPNKNLACAQRYLIPKKSGLLKNVQGVSEAENANGVVMSNFFIPEIGSKISKAKSHSDRFGHVICVAESLIEAKRMAENAISKVIIEIENEKN